MDPLQAHQIEQLQKRLEMSDGELLRLAREIAHNGRLVNFAELSWFESRELAGVLELLERNRVAAAMQAEELVAR